MKNTELYWIYKISDQNFKEEISKIGQMENLYNIFPNTGLYLSKKFGPIYQISPFWYIDWNEHEIINLLKNKLKFKLPKKSWPDKSSNCLFNYVSQYLARKYFGYSQHEVELSCLVREGELSRERALEVNNSPITEESLNISLKKIELTLDDIK